jgi:cytochrome c-type biogenesis protein CcmE
VKKKKFFIAGIIVFLAIAYLGYIGIRGAATYYLTVSEFLEQGSYIYGENMRVNGQVVAGSVEQKGLMLRFTISEGGKNLPVVYEGVVPDTFKVGSDVVVEGKLNPDGIFEAHTLMPKCPARYVPLR